MPKANKNNQNRGSNKQEVDPKNKMVMLLKNGKVRFVRAGDLEERLRPSK